LPGAPLAERRRDRPVDGPDQPAATGADRPGRAATAAARRARDLRGDALVLARERRDVLLVLDAVRLHAAEQVLALVASVREVVALGGDVLAHPGDLVALRRDGVHHGLLALLERAQALGRRRRLRLVARDARDDPLVLMADAADELAALEQVGEAVGVEDHGH